MPTITFRTDATVDRALAGLMSDGANRSQAIRKAIITASRVHAMRQLRAEAEEIAADPEDVSEARRILSDMASLRA